MAKEFEGKSALVTGASRGIGRATAVRLAEGGCAIALGYAGNEAAAGEAKAACEKAGAARVQLVKFDVADPEACAKAVDEVIKQLGGLQILVNNAGISIDGLILRYKADDLRRVLDVDLASAFHLSKAAVRPMMKQRGGNIVNLTSVVGEQGNAGQTAYAAAKAGLIGLTNALARGSALLALVRVEHPVPTAAHGLDEIAARAELLAQPLDVRIHGARLQVRAHVPDVPQERRARLQPADPRHEGGEQLELQRGERDLLVGDEGAVRGRVDPQRTDFFLQD